MMFDRQPLRSSPPVERTVIAVGAERPLPAMILRPAGMDPRLPALIALHGIGREIEAFRTVFTAEAAATGRVIVLPHFSAPDWPVFQRITRRHRPDLALLALIADLRLRGIIGTAPSDLFGFSGGAQLAHRFAMLHPEQVGALHLGAAGWYTLPDPALPYPLGLGTPPRGGEGWERRMASGLDIFLDREITVHVGAQDDALDAPSLRRNPALDAAQGTNRLARARRYVETVTAAQRARGLPVRCRLHVLQGVGHDFADCVRLADLAAGAAL